METNNDKNNKLYNDFLSAKYDKALMEIELKKIRLASLKLFQENLNNPENILETPKEDVLYYIPVFKDWYNENYEDWVKEKKTLTKSIIEGEFSSTEEFNKANERLTELIEILSLKTMIKAMFVTPPTLKNTDLDSFKKYLSEKISELEAEISGFPEFVNSGKWEASFEEESKEYLSTLDFINDKKAKLKNLGEDFKDIFKK